MEELMLYVRYQAKPGCREKFVRQLVEEGRLEYLPVGNRRLTTVRALLDYYQRAKVPAAL